MHFGMLRSTDGQRFTSVSQSSFDCLGPTHGGRKLLRNVANYLPTDTKPYPGKTQVRSSEIWICAVAFMVTQILLTMVCLSQTLRSRGRTETLIY